jgi:hypothetical protein
MKIELKQDSVEFIAEDGRIAFEVCAGKDGRSIEIRGRNIFKVRDVLYDSSLEIEPRVANAIIVKAKKYE